MVDKQEKRLIVHFYQNANGKKPLKQWISSLSVEDRREIGSDINILEHKWPIGMPLCKSLGRGLYEVRSTLSDNRACRIIFCIEQNRMILLHGFM